MKIKRISMIALLLALVLALSACSVGEIKSSADEARVVGTCGEHEIRYEELRYLAVRYKDDLRAQYGEDIFATEESGATYEALLWELISEALCAEYAIVEQCLTRDIFIDDKITKDEVQEYVDETADLCGGKAGYVEYLAQNGMTDAVFRFNAALLSCQYRYYEALAAEKDKEAYDAVMAGDGFIRTMSIFVKNDEGESAVKNRAMAQEVVDAVRRGAAVSDYIGTRYNQDTGNCDYYFMRGYFIEAYEDVAFSLEIGEVSDVVEVEDGFYVIQRMAPEAGYFRDNLDALKAMYLSCYMNTEATDITERLAVTWNEYGKSIVLWSME